MRVPFLDLKAITARQRQELLDAASRVVDSGWFIGGSAGRSFENEFATYVGARHCVGVGNGLDALTLALRALGVGAGDDVLVPSHTFIATWLAVSATGARPVGVEPNESTMLIEPEGLLRATTDRTRAVMPVDLYGIPCDIGAIVSLARARGWKVVEDAAQAHGAAVRGTRIGSQADATAWSFYPGKNLGALGDAGCVTTDDDVLAEQVRMLGNYGSRIKYEHLVAGVNSRLDELQAAMLSVKLTALAADNERRTEIAELYLTGLASTGILLPVIPADTTPVWHLFPIRSERRDELAAHLATRGIETLIHYPTPPHRSAAYAAEGQRFPLADKLSRSLLSLPMGPHLSDEQVAYVVAAVTDWCS